MPDRGRERDFNEFEDDRPRRMRRSEEEWRRERDGLRSERERGRMTQHADEENERGQRGRRNGVDRGGTPSLGAASAFGETYVTAIERSASLFGNNLRLWQGETMRFMSERLERDAEVMEQMGQAKNLFDLFAIHQRWLNELATSYGQEFMRLSKLTRSTAEESLSAGRSMGRRVSEAGEEFADDFRDKARSMGEQQSMQ